MGLVPRRKETIMEDYQPTKDELLFDACSHPDSYDDPIGEATRLLDEGASPMAINEGDGYTAIGEAATQEGVGPDLVRLLVARGCPVNLEDRHSGSTPLVSAVLANNVEAVGTLLTLGARPDAVVPAGPDSWGAISEQRTSHPPLFLAVRRDHREIAEMLVSAGAPLDERVVDSFSRHVDQGASALHAAASAGRVEMVSLLIESGADVGALDARGRTPLHLAGIELDQTPRRMETAALLVAAGSDLAAKDEDGKTFADLCGPNLYAKIEPLISAMSESRTLQEELAPRTEKPVSRRRI
jgi:uncharacterized protein